MCRVSCVIRVAAVVVCRYLDVVVEPDAQAPVNIDMEGGVTITLPCVSVLVAGWLAGGASGGGISRAARCYMLYMRTAT